MDHNTPKPVWRRDSRTHTGGSVVSEVWLPEVDRPLSPLHITLSQVCMMEQSQAQGKGKGEVEGHSFGEPWKVTDDSGYFSRDMSTLKSPSPLEPEQDCTPSKQKQDRGLAKKLTSLEWEQNDCPDDLPDDVADLIFAEVAIETLEDTLGSGSDESDYTCANNSQEPLIAASQECIGKTVEQARETTKMAPGKIHSHTSMDREGLEMIRDSCASVPSEVAPQHQESGSCTVNGASMAEETAETVLDQTQDYWDLNDCSHAFADTSTATSSEMVADRLLQGLVPARPRPTTIKPQLGSLLSDRLEHTSNRVSLADVVYCPPRRRDPAELSGLSVPSCVQSVSSHNAGIFRFSSDFFSTFSLRAGSVCVGDGGVVSLREGTVGTTELWEAFLTSPGVDPRLVTYRWFDNHFKNLVTKLASMEVAYPELLGGRCLTPDWLMLQMKYRYDREIDRAERPAIRKICEHDDIPSRRMVLYVSKCCPPLNSGLTMTEPNSPSNGTLQEQNANSVTVELSDGWYNLPCELDLPLSHMIKRGKITVGTKLLVSGAELVGLPSPCHPLEVPDTCRLKISANSTRRARWFARLGYQPSPQPFPVALESLFAEGGRVGCVDAVIARVYPLIYLERGSKRMRCERAEQREVSRHRRVREKAVERITSRVQRDFESEVALQGELK